jgi:hypothetical protein
MYVSTASIHSSFSHKSRRARHGFPISLDFSICRFPQWNSLRADGRVSEGRFDFFGSAQTSDRRTSAQKGLILSQLLAQVDVIIRFLGFATKNFLGQGDSLFFFWKKFGI